MPLMVALNSGRKQSIGGENTGLTHKTAKYYESGAVERVWNLKQLVVSQRCPDYDCDGGIRASDEVHSS